jgi:sarcosine oxidase delta subunit
MAEPNPKVDLKIDANRLAYLIDAAVVASSEVVNFHFSALGAADLSKPSEPDELRYRFKGPQLTANDRRTVHENWILAKGFQELLRAVRHALEEAHVYTTLLSRPHKARSNVTLEQLLIPFQKKAKNLEFHRLLAEVNEKLDPKLNFVDAYQFLQKVRNCLEHCNGIVDKVAAKGGETFVMSTPRAKIFYMRNGTEVEVAKGHVVDAGDDRDAVQLLFKLEVRTRTFNLGERVIFTAAEFNEIAFACHILGQQLSAGLPRAPIAA